MVDTRFHICAGPLPLMSLLGATSAAPIVPDDARVQSMVVDGAEELAAAGPAHVALAGHRNYLEALKATSAGVVVVSPQLQEAVPPTAIAIVAEQPHQLFVDILHVLYPQHPRGWAAGIGESIQPLVEPDVHLGRHVVLGEGVEIGSGTIVGANTVIGPGVAIGRNCMIASNCTIECSYLGSDVVLHAGARIGCEGFGWLEHGSTNRKIPQLGRVILQDGVEVGANSTIDRGALGDTVIGEGTKIDNLVQIGHNCHIGRYCLVAAQSGLSGSTVLEDGVLMGGGSGTGGHLTLGAGTVVYGRAGVSKSWPAGSRLFGAPARDIKEYWREAAMLRRMSKGEN